MKRALVGAALLAALLSTSAAAAGSRIQAVDTSSFPSLRVTYVAPAGSPAPQLRENGRTVSTTQVVNLAKTKSIVVAIDRSRSMRRQAPRERAGGGRTVRVERRAGRSRRRRRLRELGDRPHAARSRPGRGPRPDCRSPRRSQVRHRVVRRDRRLRGQPRSRPPARARDRRRHRRGGCLEHALAGRGSRRRAEGARSGLHDRHRRSRLHRLGAAEAVGRDRRHLPAGVVVSPARGDVRSVRQELSRTWQLTYLTSSRPGAHINLTATARGAVAHFAAALPGVGRRHRHGPQPG